jgi:hypothetical protein
MNAKGLGKPVKRRGITSFFDEFRHSLNKVSVSISLRGSLFDA